MGEPVSRYKDAVLWDIHRALEFYRNLGVKSVPAGMSASIEAMLGDAGPGPVKAAEASARYCAMPGDEKGKERQLHQLRSHIGNCQRCRLSVERKNIVFGAGNPCAELLFAGEGPGREEDIQGIPFVGAAGELLTRIIKAMGFERTEVYIANAVKCRPPGNRDPGGDEIDTCIPFLRKQIEIIAPRVIVALGRVAAQALLQTTESIGNLRGRFHDLSGVPVMVTYHPAYLLRYPDAKKTVWQDVQMVMKLLGKEIPGLASRS